MSTCIQCGGEHNRFKGNSITKPADYCSKECIKKAYYFRKNPNAKSLGKSDGFWKTQTGVGYKWEQYVAHKLNGEHVPFNKEGVDVKTSLGNLDVKVCENYQGQWVFNKNKPKEHIDFYYCICLDGGNVRKELLIPREAFKGRGITVGIKSRYDEYLITI